MSTTQGHDHGQEAPSSVAGVIDELREPTRAYRRASGRPWAAFAELSQAAVADGEVPGRIKELVALALGVAAHCDGCVAYHARAAVRKGASRQEAVEILDITLLMSGGPASVWAPRALATFDEFAASP